MHCFTEGNQQNGIHEVKKNIITNLYAHEELRKFKIILLSIFCKYVCQTPASHNSFSDMNGL